MSLINKAATLDFFIYDNFPSCAFFKSVTTDLWMIASMIPATVKMPPIIAQIWTKKCKKPSFLWVNLTVMGEISYLNQEVRGWRCQGKSSGPEIQSCQHINFDIVAIGCKLMDIKLRLIKLLVGCRDNVDIVLMHNTFVFQLLWFNLLYLVQRIQNTLFTEIPRGKWGQWWLWRLSEYDLISLRSVAEPKERWLIIWLKSILFLPISFKMGAKAGKNACDEMWKFPGTLFIIM